MAMSRRSVRHGGRLRCCHIFISLGPTLRMRRRLNALLRVQSVGTMRLLALFSFAM
jgi:hypothetical protein